MTNKEAIEYLQTLDPKEEFHVDLKVFDPEDTERYTYVELHPYADAGLTADYYGDEYVI